MTPEQDNYAPTPVRRQVPLRITAVGALVLMVMSTLAVVGVGVKPASAAYNVAYGYQKCHYQSTGRQVCTYTTGRQDWQNNVIVNVQARGYVKNAYVWLEIVITNSVSQQVVFRDKIQKRVTYSGETLTYPKTINCGYGQYLVQTWTWQSVSGYTPQPYVGIYLPGGWRDTSHE